MLCDWRKTLDSPWALLTIIGRIDFDDEDTMMDARRELMQLSGGVARHWERKFSAFPFKRDRIFSLDYDEDEKDEVEQENLRLRAAKATPALMDDGALGGLPGKDHKKGKDYQAKNGRGAKGAAADGY